MTCSELGHFSGFVCDARPVYYYCLQTISSADLTFNVVFPKCSYIFLKWSATRIMAVLCTAVEIESSNLL